MCVSGGRRGGRARADQSYTQFAVMDDENVSALQQVTDRVLTDHPAFNIRFYNICALYLKF